MLKSLMLIVNPFSGRGKAKEFLYDILEQFCHKGYLVNVFPAASRWSSAWAGTALCPIPFPVSCTARSARP